MVLLIVFVALLIATRLMIEAQRRSVIELHRALDPAVPIALKQLRGDVTAASGGTGVAFLGDPLTLYLPSGVEITYELSGGELLRKVSDPPGQRVLLTGVHGFQWWWLPSARRPLVNIEVTYEKTRRAGPEVADGQQVFVPRGVETQTLVLTLRGRGRRGW